MREWIGSLGVYCARSPGGIERGSAVEQAVSRSRGCARDVVAAQGNEQAAEFGAVFQIHADHFEAGLMRAHEANYGLHAYRAQTCGDFQGGLGADGQLQFTAEKAAIEAEHAD